MGADVARAFADEGADLVLTTRTAAKLEPLAAELRAKGTRVATISADFTRDADIDRLAEDAWAVFGGLDVVLLSSQPPEPNQGELLELSTEVLAEQQQAIVWGPFRLLRHVVPRMIAAKIPASIITVTSSTGFGAYGIAKDHDPANGDGMGQARHPLQRLPARPCGHRRRRAGRRL